MSEIARIIEETSKLPLLDAAYLLWMRKSDMDILEKIATPVGNSPDDVSSEEAFRIVTGAAAAAVLAVQTTARGGSAFERLKLAHPEATDADMELAMRAAIKFDRDCSIYFSYKSEDYLDDVGRAIEEAKRQNPLFLEKTYNAAWNRLANALK